MMLRISARAAKRLAMLRSGVVTCVNGHDSF